MRSLTPPPLLFILPHRFYAYHPKTPLLKDPPLPSSCPLVIENPFIRFIPLDPPYPRTFRNFILSYQIARIKKRMEIKGAFLFQTLSLFGKKYLGIFPKDKQETFSSLSLSKKSSFFLWPCLLLSLLARLSSHPLFSHKESFLFFLYGKTSGLRQFVFLENTLILTRFHGAEEFLSPEKIKDRLHETRLYVERLSQKPFHTIPIIGLMEEDISAFSSLQQITSLSLLPKTALSQFLGLPHSSACSIESLLLSAFFQKHLLCKKAHLLKSSLEHSTQALYGISTALLAASLWMGWKTYTTYHKETIQEEILLKKIDSLKYQELANFPIPPSFTNPDFLEQAKVLAEKQKSLYTLQKEPFVLLSKIAPFLGKSWKIQDISWSYSANPPYKIMLSLKIFPAFPFLSVEKTVEEVESLKEVFLPAFSESITHASFSLPETPPSTLQDTSSLFPLTLMVEKEITP